MVTPSIPPRLQELRDKRDAHPQRALTAKEWDTLDFLEREHDPATYEARREEGRRQLRLKNARELSIEDLKMVLAEKRKT